MLVSLTAYLFPVEETILPPTMGHYIHAAFLDILRQADTKLAERMHIDRLYKPFTVSPLQGKFDKQGKGKLLIHAGTECWLRFTIMDDDLLSTVAKFFLENEFTTLCLDSNIFQITKVTTNKDSANGNWSACTTFEEILDSASTFNRLGVRFYSPTAFRIQDSTAKTAQNHVFPDPLHCFQSWVRKWNAISPIPIDRKALLDFAQKHIQFSRYSLKTRIMNFGGYKQLGFVGDCEYRSTNHISANGSDGMNDKTRKLLKQADALSRFAFYCGTGYKTTMGMGQTRRQKPVGSSKT